MALEEIDRVASGMRLVSALDLVRLATQEVPPNAFGAKGWGLLMKIRGVLVEWIERERRLPDEGEPDEIVEGIVTDLGERYAWEVFLDMTGWLLEDAEAKRLSTDGVRRVLDSVGRRLVRGLLAQASARLN